MHSLKTETFKYRKMKITEKRNRILVLSAVFPPEPTISGKVAFDLANTLCKDNDVVAITPKPTRPYNTNYNNTTPINYPFTHHVLKTYTCPKTVLFGRLRESYSFGKAIIKYLKREKENIDLIYAQPWPAFAQLFLIRTAKKLNIPVIMCIHDIYPESFTSQMPDFIGRFLNRVFLPFDKYILQNSIRVVTISPQMKDYLVSSRDLNESMVHIVRNWQNDELYTSQKYQHTKESEPFFTYMYLGNMSPSAGIDLLIQSFANAKIKNAKLVIAGSGSDKERCMNLANEYPYCKIEFTVAQSEDVPALQAQADVLLLPLKKGVGKTASPSKLPAYMFSAKPIIACIDEESDSGDIIRNAKCGWILRPEDQEELTDKMKHVAGLDKNQLITLGENGYNYAIKTLSRKSNLQKLTTIVKEAL
jgi:glycosyltransferase involved in cell wall biosynthesis